VNMIADPVQVLAMLRDFYHRHIDEPGLAAAA